VEDEEALRDLVASLLTDQGYTVLAAQDGKEAINIAKERDDIDLLITDVVMPGLNGSELAGIIRVFLPDLRLLFMSGYTTDLVTQHGVLNTDITLLEKPFTKNSLLSTVRMVLEKPVSEQ
jgi:CheY-like chemotaxis protein